ERAPRPGRAAWEAERLGLEALVKVAPRDPATDLRVAGADLVGFLVDEPSDLPVELSLQPVEATLRRELVGAHVPEDDLRAVGEEAPELDHVVERLAVGDGVRAGRVVAAHPADG